MRWRAVALALLSVLLSFGWPARLAAQDGAGPAVETSPGAPNESPSTSPWPDAFTASPEALLRAAQRPLPESLRRTGSPVTVLWRDESLTFDAEGRARRHRHWVYRIERADAAAIWGQSELAWSPWFENTPRLRARVVTRSGEEHWLDVGDALERAGGKRIRGLSASDQRLVRLPLPGVELGAVVEEELVVEEHRAPFLHTRHGRLALALPVPIARGQLRFVTPESWPLRFRSALLGEVTPRVRATSLGKETLYEYGPLPAPSAPEPGLLPQDPRFPTVSFSSGTSWQPVAGALAEVVEPLIQQAQDQPSNVPRRARTDVDRLGELLTALHRRVEVEDGGIVSLAAQAPQAPRKTLGSGAGDGLDLAVVLVGWLRAEGIPAFVALVVRGPGQDVDPELPGEQLFQRPMVYVPGAEPIWVDISSPWARAGEADPDLSGRMALVLSPSTQGIVRLPWTQAKDHRTQTTVEIFLAEEGPSRILETTEMVGFSAVAQRRLLADLDVEQRRQAYLAYVQSALRAPRLGVVEDTAPDNLVVPYRLQLEALDAERAFTAGDEAAVAIAQRDLVTGLSPELLTTPRGSRMGDYFFSRPQDVTWRYRIHLPSGMVPRSLPDNVERALGSGTLRQSFRHQGGVVEADFHFHSGPIFLSARQFEAYRQAVSEVLQQGTLVLWFDRP